MPIKFNVIEKGQPGAVGGGVKKQYANTVRMGKMTLDQLTTGIEKISTAYPTACKNKINMGKKERKEKECGEVEIEKLGVADKDWCKT